MIDNALDVRANCLACGSDITYPLYNPAPQPMGMINLPHTREAALRSPLFPMNFRACSFCGHVFNIDFDYDLIPYQGDSNMMFNRGELWMKHLNAMIDVLVRDYDAAGKTLVDIGCGDGLFFQLLTERRLGCRCIGYEPGIEAETARKNGLVVERDYFVPERDLEKTRPDVLVCRHVIEHMDDPRSFLRSIVYWCNRHELFPTFMVEVPRIDRAVAQSRITDFLYEHVSNFTDRSFRAVFESTGYEICDLRPFYGDEVLVAVVRPQKLAHLNEIQIASKKFYDDVGLQSVRVREQLEALRRAGKKVAFWGAASKGAAFLNAFGIDAANFPIVVDSDLNKVGRFVPGAGQEIRSPDYLIERPVDVVVITTRWRAKDIVAEMKRRGITYQDALTLQGAQLQSYREEYADEQATGQEKRQVIAPPHFLGDSRRNSESGRTGLGIVPLAGNIPYGDLPSWR